MAQAQLQGTACREALWSSERIQGEQLLTGPAMEVVAAGLHLRLASRKQRPLLPSSGKA